MDNKSLKVIFCGATDEQVSRSWGKTNSFLINHLQNHTTVLSAINYGLNSKLLSYFHKVYCMIFLGEMSFRDGFINYFMEKKFIREYRKIEEKPDVFIHSGVVCIPSGLKQEAPHVLFVDATIMGGINYNGLRFSRRHMKVFIRNTRKYQDRLSHIFTFNEWTKNSLVNDFAVNPEKIHNTGFGANLDPYYGDKDYSNGLILTVLRRGLEKTKGLYLLLEGFRLAREKKKNLTLAVVGTTLKPAEGVEYYEGHPRTKTIELFRKASLFAMPALFEPNGMVYPEALSSKTPILGLNRLAFPEFSGYGKYGFITDPTPESIAETIIRATDNPALLEKMGKEGQEFAVKRYNWDNVVQEVLRIVFFSQT